MIKERTFKNLMVTGGLGFIGCNFIKYLLKTNFEGTIINVDKQSYASNINDIDDNCYVFYKTDLLQKNELNLIFNAITIDAIVHFADKIDETIDFYSKLFR